MKPLAVAVVDPYSTGSLLVEELARRGCERVAVYSTPEVPPVYRSAKRASDFSAELRHRSLADTAAELRQLGVGCVMAGCELGVGLADALSEELGTPSNGTRLSSARRDKALMADTLRAHGVPTPRGVSAESTAGALGWARDHGSWLLVVKPTRSTGSDQVYRCESEEEASAACERILHRDNVMGERNHAVLVQELIEGTEYAVDTVSCRGSHRVAAFWRYGKQGGSSFVGADSIELLASEGAAQDRLRATATRALEALGIAHGPAHCELIDRGEQTWLIEVGARLHGGGNTLISRECSGISQVELTVTSYLEPESFLQQLDRPYELHKRGMLVFLTPPSGSGRLTGFPRREELEGLPSVDEVYLGRRWGPPIPRIVGWVRLIHPDPEVVHRDLGRIRELESGGLYVIEAEG